MGSIADQLHDIQGNILRAYGFPFARYEVLRIVDRTGARRLLRSALDQQLIMTARTWDPQSKPSCALNVFFSWAGLAAMGLPQASLDSFPEEFRLGMAARAKRLGDVGRNAPATWEFGQEPDRNHVFFALYGRTLEDSGPDAREAPQRAGVGGVGRGSDAPARRTDAGQPQGALRLRGRHRPAIDQGQRRRGVSGRGDAGERRVGPARGGRVRARVRRRNRVRHPDPSARRSRAQWQFPRLPAARTARGSVPRLPHGAGRTRIPGFRRRRSSLPRSWSADGGAAVRSHSGPRKTTRSSPGTGWRTTRSGTRTTQRAQPVRSARTSGA